MNGTNHKFLDWRLKKSLIFKPQWFTKSKTTKIQRHSTIRKKNSLPQSFSINIFCIIWYDDAYLTSYLRMLNNSTIYNLHGLIIRWEISYTKIINRNVAYMYCHNLYFHSSMVSVQHVWVTIYRTYYK